MDNKEFSKILELRTRKFAVIIINLSSSLPNTPEGKVVRNQITKSGSSIGANYREANRARGKADFSNKISISEGEANETLFWLETIEDLNWSKQNILNSAMVECKELLALFTTISYKSKLKQV